jgi:hypothetical protein
VNSLAWAKASQTTLRDRPRHPHTQGFFATGH